ncbi:MAG: riboflavin biosynthesis protein RibF [Coriobacteriales bacterium]|nr:riboflavin biosynthesis protein RibF [Coriobacteriales bacterium]
MSGLQWAPLRCDNVCARSFANGMAYAQDVASITRVMDARDPSVVVCGVFDGIHVGHRRLLDDALAQARDAQVPCVVVTFDPDPSEVLGRDEDATRLLSCVDRVQGLLAMGVDVVLVFGFTHEFAALEPQQFVHDRLLASVNPMSVFVGANFRYGRGGSGDAALLERMGARLGFSVVTHKLERLDGKVVSATRVRRLLAEGRLDEANALLGRCHYVRGVVEHGRGQGTGFGFPTANVACETNTCMPAEGVYACYVICQDRAWPAAANVGAPPTFGKHKSLFLEATLVGFEGDLYGREVCVSFVAWLRASRSFSSVEELSEVVLGNIDWVRRNLGEGETEVMA